MFVEFSCTANTGLECVRCLAPYNQALATSFQEVYAFRRDQVTESGLLVPEDGNIDLAPLVNEYMQLEIPIKPLCRPDCKGLCVECGADLSAFSMFKLLGPEGIGCVVGKKRYIEKIVAANYSGGGQVQGHEALACLRGMIYAPVALAIHRQERPIRIARNATVRAWARCMFMTPAACKVPPAASTPV